MPEPAPVAGPDRSGAKAGPMYTIAAVVGVFVLSVIIVPATLRGIVSARDLHPGSPTVLWADTMALSLALLLATLTPLLGGAMTLRELGFCRPAGPPRRVFRVTLVAALLSLATLLAFLALFRLLGGELGLPGEAGGSVVLAAYLARLVLFSTGEEFLFRGALQPLANRRLAGRLRLGPLQVRRGTLAVAALFGLAHLVTGGGLVGVPAGAWPVPTTITTFIGGVIFGQVRDDLETVWVPVFLHVLVNLVSLAFAVAL